MAIETRITTINLNDMTYTDSAGETQTLRYLEKNARYMNNDEFQRLVTNIKHDGQMTSFPCIYRGEILSGNHRTKAAIAAGLEEANAIEIISELSDDHKTAIILSHNAISGKDDMSILQEIYNSIESLEMKEYSAITENMFKMDDINIDSLSFAQPIHEEVILAFLPEDFDELLTSFKEIGKNYKSNKTVLTASMDDFDNILKAVTKVKSQKQIINTSLAICVMAKLALEYLEKLEGLNDGKQAES